MEQSHLLFETQCFGYTYLYCNGQKEKFSKSGICSLLLRYDARLTEIGKDVEE
jgi:hypothetical protein